MKLARFGVILLMIGGLTFSGSAVESQVSLWRLMGSAVVLSNAALPVGIGVENPQAKVHIKSTKIGLLSEAEEQGIAAVRGKNPAGFGIQGFSEIGVGVEGVSSDGIGISGLSTSSIAVQGDSVTGSGVRGLSGSGAGVEGASAGGPGVQGSSANEVGVIGISNTDAAIRGISSLGNALELIAFGGTYLIDAMNAAAPESQRSRFTVTRDAGRVWSKGGYQTQTRGWAERFFDQTNDGFEVGDVLSLDSDGSIRLNQAAYNTAVIGVFSPQTGFVSGATEEEGGITVAIGGVVKVKVSTENGPIMPGDLLTTSPTPGVAMRCGDRMKCFGALLGKALEPLTSGEGLIEVLLVLQ